MKGRVRTATHKATILTWTGEERPVQVRLKDNGLGAWWISLRGTHWRATDGALKGHTVEKSETLLMLDSLEAL